MTEPCNNFTRTVINTAGIAKGFKLLSLIRRPITFTTCVLTLILAHRFCAIERFLDILVSIGKHNTTLCRYCIQRLLVGWVIVGGSFNFKKQLLLRCLLPH